MNSRRKTRLWLVLAVLTGLGITAALILYTLRTNIDLFYTPGEVIYGKRHNGQKPEPGQHLRIGGMVVPGSIQRDGNSLQVNFKLYDNHGTVDVSYNGVLPDLFREGQGVVAQGILKDNTHIIAREVLAKHDENYTPPEVKSAMGAPAIANSARKENGS